MITMKSVAWDHGCLAVQNLAAMIGPVTFVLPDGRQCQPLHIAPWTFDAEAAALPGVLRRLRGEWPCVPFGFDGERTLAAGWEARGETFLGADLIHGPGSHEEWRWIDAPEGSLALAIDYPASHPVARVTRRITPDPRHAAIDFTLGVEVRRACRLPIALHPVFRVPDAPGGLILEPDGYDHVRTFPGTVEPGATLFAQDAKFARLTAAPLQGGGVVDASILPFDGHFEELLQLIGAQGRIDLRYTAERYRARLTWDARHFPSLQLWISNRGRRDYPWNGRHLALGVEPVCGAFDLGPAIADARNPIAEDGTATAFAFSPDQPFMTRYRIAVEPDL